MIVIFHTISNLVILLGSVWALWTHKVPTRTGGSAILGVIAVSSLVNLESAPIDRAEVMLSTSIAVAVLWAFWWLEARNWSVSKWLS